MRGSTAHLYPKDVRELVLPDLCDLSSAVDDAAVVAASRYRDDLDALGSFEELCDAAIAELFG